MNSHGQSPSTCGYGCGPAFSAGLARSPLSKGKSYSGFKSVRTVVANVVKEPCR